jgi:hypothetical protein
MLTPLSQGTDAISSVIAGVGGAIVPGALQKEPRWI